MTQSIHPSWYREQPQPTPQRRYLIPLSIALREGRCVDCGASGPAVRGRIPRCAADREAWNAARRRRYRERRSRGLCGECGLRPGVANPLDPEDAALRRTLCAVCLTRHRR